MKKIVCVLAGLILLSPVIGAQEIMQLPSTVIENNRRMVEMMENGYFPEAKHLSNDMIEKIENEAQLRNVIATLMAKLIYDNRMLRNVSVVLAEEKAIGKKIPSFEALDLLGMSFNTLKDPMNIKTAGEHHAAQEKRYKEDALTIIDLWFVLNYSMSLADMAAQAKPYTKTYNASDHELVNAALFAQLDGHYGDRLNAENAASK